MDHKEMDTTGAALHQRMSTASHPWITVPTVQLMKIEAEVKSILSSRASYLKESPSDPVHGDAPEGWKEGHTAFL